MSSGLAGVGFGSAAGMASGAIAGAVWGVRIGGIVGAGVGALQDHQGVVGLIPDLDIRRAQVQQAEQGGGQQEAQGTQPGQGRTPAGAGARRFSRISAALTSEKTTSTRVLVAPASPTRPSLPFHRQGCRCHPSLPG